MRGGCYTGRVSLLGAKLARVGAISGGLWITG